MGTALDCSADGVDHGGADDAGGATLHSEFDPHSEVLLVGGAERLLILKILAERVDADAG